MDYAYGFMGCYLLPKAKFDRACYPAMKALTSNKALCPKKDNPEEDTWCNPDLSFQNPDSWSFIASGIYFSNECGKKIEFPQLPSIPKGSYDTGDVENETMEKGKGKCPAFSIFD